MLVVHIDVHQGDGAHTAFHDEWDASPSSINGFGNYPFKRDAADVELDLPDRTGDEAYLQAAARLGPG